MWDNEFRWIVLNALINNGSSSSSDRLAPIYSKKFLNAPFRSGLTVRQLVSRRNHARFAICIQPQSRQHSIYRTMLNMQYVATAETVAIPLDE
jgi:hypothetical protein